MKKILLTIWMTAMMAVALGGTRAEALIDLYPETSGDQAICRGGRDWGTFISAIIGYDDFKEYWKDILVRYSSNICHYQDIDSLMTRITKVRKQLRSAFYVCGNMAAMKRTYYELEAELYFLRKFIETDYSNFTVVSDQKVIDSLRGYFVINKGYFSDDEITTLFNRFKERYRTRLVAYQNCTDPVWQSLVDKWNEFKETAGGITPAVNRAGESFEKRWDRMKNTSVGAERDFWGGIVDLRINGLPAKEGWEQIAKNFQENMPGGFTFQQIQAAKTVSDATYNVQEEEANYMAQYQMLYLESSDEFMREIKARLNTMDKIITDTYPFQNQTIQCVKSINNKQC